MFIGPSFKPFKVVGNDKLVAHPAWPGQKNIGLPT